VSVVLPSTIRMAYITKSKSYSSLCHNKDLLIDCVFFHIGKKRGVVSNQITVSIIVDFLHVKATFGRHRKSVDIL
jgi:hypothetical protein